MFHKLLVIVLGAFVVSGCVDPKIPSFSDSASTLRLKVKPGDTWTYTYKVATFADPTHIKAGSKLKGVLKEYSRADLTGEFTLKVEKVKDGKATFSSSNKVLTSVGVGDWKKQAEEMLQNPIEKQEWEWDERLRYTTKGVVLDPMTNTLNSMFPEKAVKIGAKWEYLPYEGGVVPVKATLAAEEVVSGVKTVRIDVIPPPTFKGDANTMSVWIDPKTGVYVQVKMKSTQNNEGFQIENEFVKTLKK